MTGTIHIIDDEDSIRDSLSFLFASRGLATQTWPSGEAFLDAQSGNAQPVNDCLCVILDVRMTGLSGLDVFERLRALHWEAPVIFLTGHADVPLAVQALKAGAFDFLEKPFNDNHLVDIVLSATETIEKKLLKNEQQQMLSGRIETLSSREVEVMQLMRQGKPNKQIAHDLNIAMRTVEVHRSRIFSKMGVRNAVELVAMLSDVSRP
ncbi:two-component system response regulator DctR [Agrobacterium vitis]|nr:two-component system response regulator DctR [Agrobacterium vitis]MBE1436609.1 two-component system response regulator DctR [Agrobacterium vitis]